MTWTVRRVDVTEYTEEEAGLAYLAVGLAESPDLVGRYLEFQLATDADERAEGYCIVDSPPEQIDPTNPLAVAAMCTSHRTVYCGITECRMSDDQLALTLTGEAQQVFGLPAVLALQLDLSDADKAPATRLDRGAVGGTQRNGPRRRPSVILNPDVGGHRGA